MRSRSGAHKKKRDSDSDAFGSGWDGSLDDDLGRDSFRERAGSDFDSNRDSDRFSYTDQHDLGPSLDDDQGRNRFLAPRYDINAQGKMTGGWGGRIGGALKEAGKSVLMSSLGGPVLGAIAQSGPLGEVGVRAGLAGVGMNRTANQLMDKINTIGSATKIKGLQRDPNATPNINRGVNPDADANKSGRIGGMAQRAGVPMPGAAPPQDLRSALAAIQSGQVGAPQQGQGMLPFLLQQPQQRRSTLFR